MHMRRTTGAVASTLVVVLLLAGCSGDGDTSDATTTSTSVASTSAATTSIVGQNPTATTTLGEPTIAVTAQASVERTDQAVGGRFRVKLINTGAEEFTILGVRLESAGFDTLTYTQQRALYTKGEETDLITPFGRARCEPGDTVAPATAALRFRTAGGAEGAMRVPMESINEALPKLHQRECDDRFIEDAVEISLSDPIRESGRGRAAIATTTLTLRRAESTERIVVTDVRGSVLYTIATDSLPVTLDQSATRAAVPIWISAARCDGHALGETKQPFVYPIRIRIGDGFETSYDIPVSRDQQDQLFDFLLRSCGLA